MVEYKLRLTEQMVWALRLLRNAFTYFAVERGEKNGASLRERLLSLVVDSSGSFDSSVSRRASMLPV